jgi:hypothetical protein
MRLWYSEAQLLVSVRVSVHILFLIIVHSYPAVPCVGVERSVINLQMMSIYEKERKCLIFWVQELI